MPYCKKSIWFLPFLISVSFAIFIDIEFISRYLNGFYQTMIGLIPLTHLILVLETILLCMYNHSFDDFLHYSNEFLIPLPILVLLSYCSGIILLNYDEKELAIYLIILTFYSAAAILRLYYLNKEEER